MNVFEGKPCIKIASILKEYQRLQDEKKELIISLKSIRGKKENWRTNIHEDTRTPVKLLNAELERVENYLLDLLSTKVVMYEPEEDNRSEAEMMFD